MLRFFSNILWTTVRRSGKIPTENLLVSMAVVISSWILIKATCINYVKERSNTEPCGRPYGAMAQRTEMSRNLNVRYLNAGLLIAVAPRYRYCSGATFTVAVAVAPLLLAESSGDSSAATFLAVF